MKYLDEKGLSYFWNKIKAKIPSKTSELTNDSNFISSESDPTVPYHVKNITEQNIMNWNNAAGETFNYYRKYTGIYSTTRENENIIPITLNGATYRADLDILSIYINGLKLEETNYSINGNNVQLVNELDVVGTEVEFVVMRSAVASIDYDLLKGEDGEGLPTGGTTGQVLAKKSNSDNDVEWVDQTGQGGATGDTLPIGAVIEWDNDVIPENWLLLNGQAVSRTDYKELFELYGTKYGAGDGSTTFNLPNRKTRVSVGKDSSDSDFDTLGKTGGEKTHKLTIDEMPNHNHSYSLYTYIGSGTMWGTLNNGTSGDKNNNANTTTGSAGGGQAHNNLQPYIVTNFIVKAKQSAGVVATVVDNLNSTSETDALSANQGKVLMDLITAVKLEMNPIGSIEINVTGVNPSTYIGGTWAAWGRGRVPVGVDASQTEFNTVEKTGGEKTHKLTVGEMPSHSHTANTIYPFASGGNKTGVPNSDSLNHYSTTTDTINETGGNQPHNNLQPYITCYMWKRIA